MVSLHFPRGVPGFEGHHRYTLSGAEPPLAMIESVDPDGPCFHAIPVAVVDPCYQIGITSEDLRLLGLDDTRQPVEGILCLAILSFNEAALTANLLAPVVVNLHSGVCVQAVREDARYSHRHPVTVTEKATAECL